MGFMIAWSCEGFFHRRSIARRATTIRAARNGYVKEQGWKKSELKNKKIGKIWKIHETSDGKMFAC